MRVKETTTTIKISITPESFFVPFVISFPTSALHNHWSVFCHYKLVCIFWNFMCKCNHIICTLWFLSLSIIILRSIHFVVCINILFLFIVSRSCCMNIPQCTCRFMYWWTFGLVSVFGYHKWIALNIHVQIFNL